MYVSWPDRWTPTVARNKTDTNNKAVAIYRAMINKGDIIQFYNRTYSAEGQQESQTEYYIVQKIQDKSTLILSGVDTPTPGSTTIHKISDLQCKYSIYEK